MMRVVAAGMRVEAVAITFKRIGRFFNNLARGSFSFPAMICKYTSLRKSRYQSAFLRYPSLSRFEIPSSSKRGGAMAALYTRASNRRELAIEAMHKLAVENENGKSIAAPWHQVRLSGAKDE
jgi:hypothetical protein